MLRLCWVLIVMMSSALSLCAAETSAPASADPVEPADMRRVAKRIEPELEGQPERLPQYINFFSRELGNDSRICAFDVTAEAVEDKNVRLRGFVEFPETHQSLVAFLEVLGFKVDDQLEKLPAAGLGEKIFGLVKAPHSYAFDKASGRRKQENDCLLGEPLMLLREQDGHLLAHGREGYLGYVKSDDVLRVDEAAYVKYLDGPRVLITANQENAEGRPEMPAGARLKLVEERGDIVVAELPTGEQVKLPTAECKIQKVPEADIEHIVATAQKLIGTRYFWGGRTSDGIDCSGLVQMGYASAGYFLPRDAYQQFYVGRLSATRWHMAGLRRGDTLYFLARDGKIRHTAMYLGDDKFVQAVMPRVKISSFNPEDPEFDADHKASFAFAKRLLD